MGGRGGSMRGAGGPMSARRRFGPKRTRLLLPREDINAAIGGAVRAQATVYDQNIIGGAAGNVERIKANISIIVSPNQAILAASPGAVVTYYLLQLPVGALVPNVAIANAFTTTLRGIKLLAFRRVAINSSSTPALINFRTRTINVLPTDRVVLVRDYLPLGLAFASGEYVSTRLMQVLPR